MNGIHDLGGMHGFGPVVREENEPTFHADWEAHVWAIMRLTMEPGYYNIDAFRHGIERMDPAHYLRSTYYERWLATIERNLVEGGYLTGDELDARTALLQDHPDTPPPQPTTAGLPPPAPLHRPEPASSPVPRFAVGDRVVTRNLNPIGHTRLPRYARGKQGVIQRLHGAHILPDTNAHGLGENPQPLYSVRFEARELWGDAAEPHQTVSLDLWDSYLDPAPA
jgi:nitrile hydratase beta subunit